MSANQAGTPGYALPSPGSANWLSSARLVGAWHNRVYGSMIIVESIATIRRSIDLGMDFLDTADVYGMWSTKIYDACAIRGRREQVVLATKFGNVRSPEGQFIGVNGRPEYVAQCCEASLQRLGVEYVDLYYQHRVDPNVPIEDTGRPCYC